MLAAIDVLMLPPVSAPTDVMFDVIASTVPALRALMGEGVLLASLTKSMPPSLMLLAFQ